MYHNELQIYNRLKDQKPSRGVCLKTIKICIKSSDSIEFQRSNFWNTFINSNKKE